MKLLLALTAVLISLTCQAKDVTVEWYANQEPVAGYRIHWGPSTRNYTNSITTTNIVATVSNLPPGGYYLALTAFDTNGLSSEFSDELSFVVNKKPQGLKIRLTLLSTPTLGLPWGELTNLTVEVPTLAQQQFYRGTLDITSNQ